MQKLQMKAHHSPLDLFSPIEKSQGPVSAVMHLNEAAKVTISEIRLQLIQTADKESDQINKN